MTDFLPIMLKMTPLPCLVVGGGRIALRKTLVLLKFGAEVTVVAEELTSGLQKLARRGLIHWRAKKFSWVDLWGKRLAIAATDNRELNHKIVGWARKIHILANAVDDGDNSEFIFPAIYRSGALTVGIATQGCYPAAARKLKQELAKRYDPGYGHYLEKLGGWRCYLKTQAGDPRRRRRILRRLLELDSETVVQWNVLDFEEWLQHERRRADGSDWH